MNNSNSGVREEFRDQILEFREGILFHVGIAALLITIFLLDIDFAAYEFNPSTRTLPTMYLSNVFHRDLGHVLGNSIFFAFFGILNLKLYSEVGKRRLYYVSMLAVFLIGPVLMGEGVAIYIEQNAPDAVSEYSSVGFSTIVAAVIAMIPVSISLYAKRISAGGNAPLFSVLIWLFGFFPVLHAYGDSLYAVAGSFIIGIVPLIFWSRGIIGEANTLVSPEYVVLTGYILLFATGVALLFPRDPGRVSVVAHLYGYIMGFLLIWTVFAADYCRGRFPSIAP